MTEEEFAKLFPNVKWPRTFQGRRGTHIGPSGLPKPAAGFSDPPMTNDALPPASMGLVRHRAPTSRERLFDLLNRNLYGDAGIGTEGNKHSKRLADFLDFTPVGALHQAYDAGKAIGEGRMNDAAQSSGLAFLPAVRKSPVNGLFNPKPKPQRPFSKDYPNGAVANEGEDLKYDIEGRPLRAPYVAGRWQPDKPDHALTPLDIQRVGEYSIEGPVDKVPSSRLGPGNLGETRLMLGRPMRINVLDSLPKDKMDIATAHEVGHVIDALSDQIPTKGIEDELDFNYSALRTGEERRFILSRPQDFGYRGKMIDRERMAEAIRAYMVDPNYLKTVAPKTAARIRQYVADSEDLTNIIQFNGLAAGGALAGSTASQTNDAEAGKLPTQAGSRGLKELTEALVRRGIRPRAPRPEFDDLVRALLELEDRQGSRFYGGPR